MTFATLSAVTGMLQVWGVSDSQQDVVVAEYEASFGLCEFLREYRVTCIEVDPELPIPPRVQWGESAKPQSA